MVVTPAEINIPQHPIRVLVADDEPNIRNLLTAALASQGYDVTAACDGDEAKRLLEREPFEVVITDYQMPGLNGIDVLRFAKLLNAACQVVNITGRDVPEAQKRRLLSARQITSRNRSAWKRSVRRWPCGRLM